MNELNINYPETSIYKLIFDNYDYMISFLDFIKCNIKNFSHNNSSFYILENNIYYKDNQFCNLLDFEKNEDKLNLLKMLLLEIPYTSFIDSVMPIESTPLFLIFSLYLNYGKDKLLKSLKDFKNKALKIYDYLMIELQNLPLLIVEINYIPKRIFEVINCLINVFEKNSKDKEYDDKLNKFLNIKDHEFKINYDSIKKIMDCLKNKKPIDKRYQNLYEELINYL